MNMFLTKCTFAHFHSQSVQRPTLQDLQQFSRMTVVFLLRQQDFVTRLLLGIAPLGSGAHGARAKQYDKIYNPIKYIRGQS